MSTVQVITAPESTTPTQAALFLAGGITGAPDWQDEFIGKILQAHFLLRLTGDLTLFNPRRPNFDVKDPSATTVQIAWEHRRLAESQAISFWFPKEAACPITLYELGYWLGRTYSTPHTTHVRHRRKIMVGVDPGYVREVDVYEQTRLADPSIRIVNTLDALAEQVIEWNRTWWSV